MNILGEYFESNTPLQAVIHELRRRGIYKDDLIISEYAKQTQVLTAQEIIDNC